MSPDSHEAYTRTQNVTGKDRCSRCHDDGQIVVTLRTISGLVDGRPVGGGKVAEYGPCPDCERGLKLEFPADQAGPWGRAGFWRGRDPKEVLA